MVRLIDDLHLMWEHLQMSQSRRPDFAGDKTEEIKLRVSPALKAKLRMIARSRGVNMSVLLRQAAEALEVNAT